MCRVPKKKEQVTNKRVPGDILKLIPTVKDHTNSNSSYEIYPKIIHITKYIEKKGAI